MSPSERLGPAAHRRPVGRTGALRRHGAAQLVARLAATATLAGAAWLLLALVGSSAWAHPHCPELASQAEACSSVAHNEPASGSGTPRQDGGPGSETAGVPTTDEATAMPAARTGTPPSGSGQPSSGRDEGMPSGTVGLVAGTVGGIANTIGNTVGAVRDTVGGVVREPVSNLPPVDAIDPLLPSEPGESARPDQPPASPSTPAPESPQATSLVEPAPTAPMRPTAMKPRAGAGRDSQEAVRTPASPNARTGTATISMGPFHHKESTVTDGPSPAAPLHPQLPGSSVIVHSGQDSNGGQRSLLGALPVAGPLGCLTAHHLANTTGIGSASRDPGLPTTSPD